MIVKNHILRLLPFVLCLIISGCLFQPEDTDFLHSEGLYKVTSIGETPIDVFIQNAGNNALGFDWPEKLEITSVNDTTFTGKVKFAKKGWVEFLGNNDRFHSFLTDYVFPGKGITDVFFRINYNCGMLFGSYTYNGPRICDFNSTSFYGERIITP